MKGSILRAATPLMIGRGFSAVITFAIPIVLARALAVDAYGTYKQFFLLAGTVFLIGQLGLTASLYYFMPRSGQDERGRYLMQALLGLLVVGALGALATLALAGSLAARFSNPQLAELAWPLAIYLFAYLGASPLEISLTATKRTGWAGFTYVASDLVRTALLLAPIKLGLGVHGVAWGAALFAIVRFIAAWLVALSGAVGRVEWPEKKALRAQLAYALPFAGVVLLAVVQMQLPQYVVAGFTDAATYAIFAVGVLQLPISEMLYAPIAEVMMVRLAQSDNAHSPAIFREAVARLCLFFLPLFAFMLAIGPELIPTLYTASYLASVPIFFITMLEMPLSALPVDGLLRAEGATTTMLQIGVLRLVAGAVLVTVGFFAFGLVGTVAGYVITQWIAKTLLLRAGARRLGITAIELLPWKEIGAWLARATVLFIAVTLLRLHGPWHGVGFLVAASLTAIVVWVASLISKGHSLLKWREAHG